VQGIAHSVRGFWNAGPWCVELDRSTCWLVSPAVDLLLGCGGLMWLLMILQSQFRLIANSVSDSAFLGIALLGTHLFSDTHISATLVKVGSERRRFAPLPVVVLPFLIGVSALLASLLVPGALSVLLRAYLVLVIHHYCRQAYGIALIYCGRAGCRITLRTKNSLNLFFDCLAAVAIIRTFCERDLLPRLLLGQELPSWGPAPSAIMLLFSVVLSLSTLLFVAMLVCEIRRVEHQFPIAAMCLVLSTAGLLLCSPKLSRDLWLFAPAFFHGSQYLLLMFSGIQDRRTTEVGFGRRFFSEYACRLLFISLTLYFGLPLALHLFGFSTAVATASVFCSVSLHHFLTDAMIWKSPKRV
jgi:hypothetical protein